MVEDMKKFVFTLEKVLNFKNQTLEVLKNELSALQRELEKLIQKINELEDVFTSTNQTLVHQMQNGVGSSEVTVYKVYLSDINAHIKQKLEEKHQLELKIAKKQTEVIGMNIEIASLDKLKEKQYEDYCKAEQNAAEIELNEFINNLSITV